MKTKSIFLLPISRTVLSACILILPLLSCNFFGVPSYELTVTLNDGVQGTPAAGIHSYKDLTEVTFDYSAVNDLHTVEVLYEGGRYQGEGNFIVYTNAALEASLVDIRDVWTLTITDGSGGSIATAEITLSGADVLGGTFSDSRGLAGTWTGPSNLVTITYSDWENYILTGTLFNMSGIWTNGDAWGTWSAVRK